MSDNSGKAEGRVIGQKFFGTEGGTLVEWTMDDARGTKVWTDKSGEHFDRMHQAYQSKDDPHSPDKVQVEYKKRKITHRGGKTQEVNWVEAVGS